MIVVSRTLLLSSLLALLISCGQEYGEIDAQRSQVGETLRISQRPLREEEKRIALRICDAFRAKWTEFRMSKLNEGFDFRYQRTNCANESRTINPLKTTLRRILDSQPLVFDSVEMEDTMQFMESHLHGHLANTCQALQSGRSYNISEQKDGKTVVFSYLEKGDHDLFTVFITTPSDNGLLVESQGSYTVLTRTKPENQQYRGMVIESRRSKSCPLNSQRNAAQFEQTFLFP